MGVIDRTLSTLATVPVRLAEADGVTARNGALADRDLSIPLAAAALARLTELGCGEGGTATRSGRSTEETPSGTLNFEPGTTGTNCTAGAGLSPLTLTTIIPPSHSTALKGATV